MSYMFRSCGQTAMTSIDLGDKFDISSVTSSFGGMFNGCGNIALTHIDLSDSSLDGNINTQTQLYGMFSGFKTNVTVHVKDQAAKNFLINYKSQMSSSIPNNNIVVGSI